MLKKLILIGMVMALCIAVPAAATIAEGTCDGIPVEQSTTAIALIPANGFVMQDGFEKAADLIAGGGNLPSSMDVGDVLVDLDCDNGILHVKYVIDDQTPDNPFDNWYLTETHVAVAASSGGIPQSKGNPVPGQFPKDDSMYFTLESLTTEYTEDVILGDLRCEETLVVAAHAVVKDPCGLIGLELALPETVTIYEANWDNNPVAYFDTIISGGTFLDGTYPTWCIDKTHTIYIPVYYTAMLYSSYEPLPPSLTDPINGDAHIDKPGNLDLVNWVINQPFVGQTGPGGIITPIDVQDAIWVLIDNNPPACNLNCQAIVSAALTSPDAEGFVPGCGDVIAIIIAPVAPLGSNWDPQVIIAQVVIGGAEIPCDTCSSETAWGAVPGMVVVEKGKSLPGFQFPGKDWATYFTVAADCCAD